MWPQQCSGKLFYTIQKGAENRNARRQHQKILMFCQSISVAEVGKLHIAKASGVNEILLEILK